MADALATELAAMLGPQHVLTEPDVMASYTVDWTGRFGGEARCVVRPADAGDVAAVLRLCAEAEAPVVAQGGNTGLVGGGVPRPVGLGTMSVDRRGGVGDPAGGGLPVVLSLQRMRHLDEVDVGASSVVAGAGVTLARWRERARSAGLDAPVDFASRDSATIGGAIATNAGGSRVVRFGTMRSQVLGIEAVLADGSVIGSLSGLPKETVGLHWPSLLAGSEGTLGVVTRARLRLVPWYRSTVTAMVSTAGPDEAVDVLARLRAGCPSLDAVELVMAEALELVAEHLGASPPVGGGDAYLIVELADHDDPTEQLAAVIGDDPAVIDSAIAAAGAAREQLVAFRDRIAESIAAAGIPLKLDVAVPVGRLTDLIAGARAAVANHGGRVIPFGHLAEGNVHVNVLHPGDVGAITESVLRLATDLGGTISAEHGVGIAKSPWLHLVRTQPELHAMAAVRRALDPQGLLNPGVLTQLA